jgi:hypothetical protein
MFRREPGRDASEVPRRFRYGAFGCEGVTRVVAADGNTSVTVGGQT